MNEDEASRSGGEASVPSLSSAAIHIKREPVDETDIKDFAETTMNELLGWYGYGKVDSRDTQGLNLHRFTASGSPNPHDEDGDGVGGGCRPDAPSPTNSSNEANNGSTKVADPVNLPPGYIVCAWCQKVGMKLFTLKTATGQKAFCSELCFTQCRRASFKKNKVCDWCKHIRHTVNYVDFQDGEQQLQFCSNKCLNQYKMNIFCRETQAHLQMHPHLQDAAKLGGPSGSSSGGTSGGSVTLITPDLWLRDCHGTTHESSSSTGINGHDGKGGGDATMSPQPSVEDDEEPISLGVRVTGDSDRQGRKHSTSTSATVTGIKDRSKLGRHNSRFRDKHKRYRSFHRMRNSAPSSSSSAIRALNVGIVEPGNPATSTITTTNSSLTSPKSSSGQPSPNLPGVASSVQQVLGNSPLNSGGGAPNISPHPPSLPPQLLAAAVAAAAAANNQQHPHPGLLPPELTRPPFGPPPLGPHYPFLGQPPSDMLLRLPHGSVRLPGGNGGQPPPGPPPFLFPPGMGFPFGLQGPPPPPPPGSGNGSTQAPQSAQPPPTHNPIMNPLLSSLLPPVAVMVPYPVIIPIPIPIPIPLPFPIPTPDFFKKTTGIKEEGSKVSAPPSATAQTPPRVSNPISSFATATVAVTSAGASTGTRESLQVSRPSSKGNNSSTSVSRLSRHVHTNSLSHLAGTSSAKRVDSVITRLAAPKLLAQAAARGLTAIDIAQALPLTSSSLTTTSSATSTALASTTVVPPSLHESSSDQSNGLDDSSDISDFPDSDAFDLEGAESEDSRLSEGTLRIGSERSRTFCPVSTPAPSLMLVAESSSSTTVRTSPPSTSAPTTAAAAFPALPSRERREEREAERREITRVENPLSRDTLDSASVEPEMKRKCLRTRLTAK